MCKGNQRCKVSTSFGIWRHQQECYREIDCFCSYTASNGRSSTQFAVLVPLQSTNADGITDAIDNGLTDVKVDGKLLSEKLVGFNFDGASVMIGVKG